MKYAKQEKNKCHQTGVGLNDSKTELTINALPNLVTPQRRQHNHSILRQFFHPSISRISQEVEDGFSFLKIRITTMTSQNWHKGINHTEHKDDDDWIKHMIITNGGRRNGRQRCGGTLLKT